MNVPSSSRVTAPNLTAQENETARQLPLFREKLLELSKRNRLLNYRHSQRSKDHVRTTDELHAGIFDKLQEQKTHSFISPPNPDPQLIDPNDERTDLFSAYLRDTRRGPDYQGRIEKLYKEPKIEKSEGVFEAELNPIWGARQHDLKPGFALVAPKEASRPKHHDAKVQILLLPEEMEAKLTATHQPIREKGINTLFAEFDFSEWFV
jgi:hypothetical protein